MAEKQAYYHITGPFGLDRRDSAIVKRSPGILYELENFIIDNGNIEVREGQTRWNSSNTDALVGAAFRILSLFRYYGLDGNEEELKEFYAAVDGNAEGFIKKWNTVSDQWDTLPLPPGVTLTSHVNAPTGERPPSLGNFEQFKDRVYYTNQKEPVLMVKKEESLVYEAGVPDADQYLMLQDCETLDPVTHAVLVAAGGEGKWAFYNSGADNDKTDYFLDGGFERHTEGDYGLTLEQRNSVTVAQSYGAYLKAVHRFDETKDLEWFYKSLTSTITTLNSAGTRIVDTGSTFNDSYIGLKVKNTDDGSTAVVIGRDGDNALITTPLSGGTNNDYGSGDTYILGGTSSEYDYFAIDIFRFTKVDIDEVIIELSSVAPDANGDFSKGFRAVVYADNDFEHFGLGQRTLLAQWALNPYSNTLFQGRFRKSWFINIDSQIDHSGDDDWSTINYMKISLQSNPQTTGGGNARITIDNIRLLKTPPIPSELNLQVATMDASEIWTLAPLHLTQIANEYVRATQGVSAKIIPSGATARYNWTGTKDLSQYGEGTLVAGSDQFSFDLCGSGTIMFPTPVITITLVDNNVRRAIGYFTAVNNFANLQTRHIHIQEFILPDDGDAGEFDWKNVDFIQVQNGGYLTGDVGFPSLYIDNLRIHPPVASKMINRFMPADLIIFDLVSRGVEHYFGENSVVDTVVDFLFHAYAKFTRQTAGQGTMVYPEYQHGRYDLTENVTSASLQLQVDNGGSFSVTFVQDNDLTEYQEFNFNMDGFWASRQLDAKGDGQWWGVDWIEIPATPEDEFSVWFSTRSMADIAGLTFRFYTNKNANWDTGTGTHTGTGSAQRILKGGGGDNFKGLAGKRIRNETTGKFGIIAWAGNGVLAPVNKLMATDTSVDATAWLTWSTGDVFTIDGYPTTGTNRGFRFGAEGKKPIPDADNYYEYHIDPNVSHGKNLSGLAKGLQKGIDFPSENEEVIEGYRESFKQYGLTELAYDGKWIRGVLTWKRSDFIEHFSGTAPWASWQCIAAHEIIVTASSKKACTINFQDLMVRKMGSVTGDQIQYKVKLEDELGFVGPASEASQAITVKGQDVNLVDIIVPYDTRIIRKRIYRTDTSGIYRYVDAIDRLSDNYLDQVPEAFLGAAIEEEYYKPPKAAFLRKVDNRMAFIDCIDRRGTRRSSRIHLSVPFVPHQVKDEECFDLVPEDGQKAIWVEWYYGTYMVWKERSIYTVEPGSFAKSPRDLTVGCIAPLSVAPIPNLGFAWLSHEGVIFGDHTNTDKDTGEQVWDYFKPYTPEQLSHAIGFYNDRYYFIFFGYDYDALRSKYVYNKNGLACYLPNKTWFKIPDWNVQAVSQWRGGTDNGELYIGTDYGYINKIFDGEEEISDDGANTVSQITSRLRAIDLDLESPHTDKYLSWIIFHAKNLSSDPNRKALLTITPYYDQRPTKALDDERIEHDYYKKYDLCVDPGYEDNTTLVGFSLDGVKRYAIKGFTLDITDQSFRPHQKAGQY